MKERNKLVILEAAQNAGMLTANATALAAVMASSGSFDVAVIVMIFEC